MRLVRTSGVLLLGLLLLMFADPRPLSFSLGAGLLSLAWALRLWAFGHLDRNTEMVTTGPYAHTRNPAYLGSFLALLGVSLAAGNLQTGVGQCVWCLGLLAILVFFGAYLPRKFAREYTRLEKRFGEQFLRHAEHVPHFWPRLRAWRSGDPRRFRWSYVQLNNEWIWGLAFVAMLLAIWNVRLWSPAYRLGWVGS